MSPYEAFAGVILAISPLRYSLVGNQHPRVAVAAAPQCLLRRTSHAQALERIGVAAHVLEASPSSTDSCHPGGRPRSQSNSSLYWTLKWALTIWASRLGWQNLAIDCQQDRKNKCEFHDFTSSSDFLGVRACAIFSWVRTFTSSRRASVCGCG